MSVDRFVSILVLVAACGGGGSADGRFLPLAEGATWTYQVAAQPPETKTVTVGPLEDVGGAKAGVMAFRVTTQKAGGTTVSWQEDTGSSILRHKEVDMSGANGATEYYVPYKLRLDETAAHTAAGASWTESYAETATDTATGATTTVQKTEVWTVVAVDEQVTVPAGTFAALHLRRVSMTAGGGGSDKHYWFARGVGKVKETGGRTEELVSYSIP